MERREFIAASLAASAAALSTNVGAQEAAASGREYYVLRRYTMQNGPQTKLTEDFIGNALIPALGRHGFGPVGAFRLEIGPETPAFYVLMPCPSLEKAAEVNLLLAKDADFLKAAEPFWNAPATTPAFVRADNSLLIAFAGWPKMTPPTAKGKRIFQLRTYESPSNGDHVRKVEMFHSGEFDIFKNAGFKPVFYADTLVGPRMPNLTYMLAFENMAELDAKWDLFDKDPAWKKLSADPRFAYEEIVSSITNLILSPLAASQI